MKLNYKLTTIDQLDGGARFVQKLSREPFHVMYYQGTVLINREAPHLDKVLQALEQWWASEDSPEIWDRSFQIISKAAGKTAALQSNQAWREATTDRRKKETAAAAAQWIDTVFEAVDLDGWDDLCDRGYDGGLLEAITSEFFERQKAEGFQQCESWLSLGRKAAFLYGYRLGQAAQGEKTR